MREKVSASSKLELSVIGPYCMTKIPSTIKILYQYEIDVITRILNIFCVSCKYLSDYNGQCNFFSAISFIEIF